MLPYLTVLLAGTHNFMSRGNCFIAQASASHHQSHLGDSDDDREESHSDDDPAGRQLGWNSIIFKSLFENLGNNSQKFFIWKRKN